MKTPHKHAEFIKAKADGKDIQERLIGTQNWLDMLEFDWDFPLNCEYRIKPEREWPVTSLSGDKLEDIWYEDATLGVKPSLILVANAAIKQYIIDSEK